MHSRRREGAYLQRSLLTLASAWAPSRARLKALESSSSCCCMLCSRPSASAFSKRSRDSCDAVQRAGRGRAKPRMRTLAYVCQGEETRQRRE